MSIKKYVFAHSNVKGLNKSLFAYYKFNSDYKDVVGKYNGNSESEVYFVQGLIENGVHFRRGGERINIDQQNKKSWSFSDGVKDLPFSISLWLNYSSFAPNFEYSGNWIINKRSGFSSGDQWQMACYENHFFFQKFDKATNTIYQGIKLPSSTFELNKFHHVVFTDDGSQTRSGMKFYINGILQNSLDASFGSYTGMSIADSALTIGNAAWQGDSNLEFNGIIDELGVWRNKTLNQEGVTELYNFGMGKTYPF